MPEKLKSRLSSHARFLFNNELWDEITVRVNKAKRVNSRFSFSVQRGCPALYFFRYVKDK
jgi:hypothetical protein